MEGQVECLLDGAFADDACARDKRVTIASASLAPLLFGGALPPSTVPCDQRPPPPFGAPRAASVGADSFALAAAPNANGGGLWQCRYDRAVPAWSRVDVEGLPEGETFSGVAVGDCRCLALAEADGSVFAWRRRRRRRRRRNGASGDADDGDDDDDEEGAEEQDGDDDKEDVPGRARCVLGPRLEPLAKQQEGPSNPLLRLPVAAVAAGRRHFLAVARPPQAAAFAWGCSARGQCAVAPGGSGGKSGSWVPGPRPIPLLGGVPLSLCAAGDAHSLVASADGASVFAFGDLGGDRGAGVACEPTLVSEEDLPLGEAGSVVALAAGGRHAVALDAQGQAHAWGGEEGSWGQVPREGGAGVGGGGRGVVRGVVAGWRHTVLVLGPEDG